MIDGFLFALTLFAVLGCGVVSGIFYAFSSFVMKALTRLPPAQGNAAMQSINIAVITPSFMAVFFGTAVVCLLLVGFALVSWHRPDAVYLLVGGLLYLVGTILVTMVFNVPRNNALAAVEADSAAGATRWMQFVPGWTAWNSVRTAAALAAAAALTIALVVESVKQ